MPTPPATPAPHAPPQPLLPALALAAALFSFAPRPAPAQKLGPFPLVFQGAGKNIVTSSVTIARREKDTLWVSFAGSTRGEQGIPIATIQKIDVPTPPVLPVVEKFLALPIPTDPAKKNRYHARAAALLSALDRAIRIYTPYRAIPGVPATDLLLLQGRLLLKTRKNNDALQVFETLLDYLPPEEPRALSAQILAGITYERIGRHFAAIEYLAPLPPPLDDEPLLSEMLFALGDAYAALGNADGALLAYLPLLVFHPYTQHNEPRVLEKVLPCYAALHEWEPLLRTIRWIHRDYPASPAATTASHYLEKYAPQLGQARNFVDPENPAPQP